jgi:hypothetical protein
MRRRRTGAPRPRCATTAAWSGNPRRARQGRRPGARTDGPAIWRREQRTLHQSPPARPRLPRARSMGCLDGSLGPGPLEPRNWPLDKVAEPPVWGILPGKGLVSGERGIPEITWKSGRSGVARDAGAVRARSVSAEPGRSKSANRAIGVVYARPGTGPHHLLSLAGVAKAPRRVCLGCGWTPILPALSSVAVDTAARML